MPGTLLVIAAGSLQIPAIEEARAMGLRVAAVDGDARAPGLALAHVSRVIDLLDSAALEAFAREERVCGVTSLCTDFAVRPAARLAAALGLPGLSEDAAANATDKRLMRRRFAEAGAPSPRCIEAKSLSEAFDAAAALGYPVAVKAPRSAGSRGVSKASARGEMDQAFALAREYERNGPILIEPWMEGPEVSVEGVCCGGKVEIVQVTDKLLFPGAYPVELGHTQPSRFDATDCTAAGVRALGLENCGFHAEIKLTPDGPKLIEIGARLGGDRIATHLTPLSTGVNLVRATVDIALGRTPAIAPLWNRGSAIRYFASAGPGVVTAVEGLDEVARMPGLALLSTGSERLGPLRAGFEIPPVRTSLDRYGYVVFSGRDAREAAERAERAAECVRIVCRPVVDSATA